MVGVSSSSSSSYKAHPIEWRLDLPLLVSAAILLAFGLMSLYSIGHSVPANAIYFRKQLVNVLIGIVPFCLFAWISPSRWRGGATWLYVFNIAALAAVFVVGKHAKGAERWIPLPGGTQFQPSELAKLLTVLTLAAFYANRQGQLRNPWMLVLGFVHVLVPCVLIRLQPHLGAALVLIVIFLAISLVAGVPTRNLALFLCVSAVAGGLGACIPTVRQRMFNNYQERRLQGLQESKKDIRNRNYQTDRAAIAFGVGGITGAGFLHGEQKTAGFIPEQHNDFILTVVGEEGGLIGCTLLLLAYGTFFWRVFLVMLNASSPFLKMAGAGIFAILGFHTFVNMAMVLQLLPVVGLWLPFMSYGGTAIWLCMACVGLLTGIRRVQRPLLF